MFKTQVITHMCVNKLYPKNEEFTKQKKGCSADYIVDGKYCLEVKMDNMADKTGNIFVEYANKNKEEVYDSGITLSAKWDYSVLYLLPSKDNIKAYEIPAQVLLDIAKEKGTKVETRPRVNGNREGFSALGYKLNYEHLAKYFKGTITL